MEKLTVVTGTGVPLRRSNVDTDQIIPAVFLKRVKKTGFEDALFYAWRRDPDFVLNRPEYKQGKILVAGPDFGIGSSREHAVWALRDCGFRVVISSRFADIFYGNTAKNGVLAAIMPQESIELLWKLLEEEPGRDMTVDLGARTVTCGDVTLPFEVGDYVYVPGIREAIGGDLSDITAWVVHAGEAREISLYVADMTEEERAIVRAGCLINYNRTRREKE